MITLTPEEEAILRPDYEAYLVKTLDDQPLSFDQWWRAMADEAKNNREGK